MDKTGILVLIVDRHHELDEALAGMELDQMETSDSNETWTVKETLVHITYWEQALLADYDRWARGEPIHELESDEEINALNAKTREQGKSMPLKQALDEFNRSFRQIINWLNGLDDQELFRPFAYGMSLGEFIGEDTWKHYAEHLDLISFRNK